VVYAREVGGERGLRQLSHQAEGTPTVTVSQVDKEFVPYVTAIPVGTLVRFPNHDNILHNVYSFSSAKKFQLPLYKDEPPEPITFDKPGAVVLGCNIHDWMVAYLYVVETPYYAKTDDKGRLELKSVPAGTYDLEVWHPLKKKRGSSPGQRVKLDDQTKLSIEFTIDLKPEWRPQRPSGAS
jgi:plastocyanin